MKVCVVSPCYNEEDVVEAFYQQLKAVLSRMEEVEHEILMVDDGSSDGTLAHLNELASHDPRLTVLSLSRNFGHQTALTAGLDHADADAVVLMDSDLQHPPELIPQMFTFWRDGFDIVSAVRRQNRGTTLLKNISSSAFYFVLNILSETKVQPGAADFCLLSRQAQQALRAMPERHRFLRGMIAWVGYKRAFIPYAAAARGGGKSKYTLRKMVAFALDAAFSFSAAPIQLATRLGICVSLGGFVYLAYVVIRALLFGDLVQGWGSLMSVVLILGGLNFTLLGLIGGYLGRVYEEVKGRPLYFLKQRPHNASHRSI